MISKFSPHGVQSVTQENGPNEFDLGKNIVDAAAEGGVQNLVYSGGADTETLTNGEVYCRMMMSMNNKPPQPERITESSRCKISTKRSDTRRAGLNSPTS